MTKVLNNTISISMILLLIVSTLQLSIYKMECLITGNTMFSLSDFEDCNTPNNDCSISGQCCCFHQIDFDLNYNAKTAFKTFVPFNPTFILKKIIPSLSFNDVSKFNLLFNNLPPPSGVELLKIVQVFRI